jgi:hypothetical protein
MPATVRKLLQQRALKDLAGFDDAVTSSAEALTPCASDKSLDMDDADLGDDAVDMSDCGSELENEDGSAPSSK